MKAYLIDPKADETVTETDEFDGTDEFVKAALNANNLGRHHFEGGDMLYFDREGLAIDLLEVRRRGVFFLLLPNELRTLAYAGKGLLINGDKSAPNIELENARVWIKPVPEPALFYVLMLMINPKGGEV